MPETMEYKLCISFIEKFIKLCDWRPSLLSAICYTSFKWGTALVTSSTIFIHIAMLHSFGNNNIHKNGFNFRYLICIMWYRIIQGCVPIRKQNGLYNFKQYDHYKIKKFNITLLYTIHICAEIIITRAINTIRHHRFATFFSNFRPSKDLSQLNASNNFSIFILSKSLF